AAPDRLGDVAGLELDLDSVAALWQRDKSVLGARARDRRSRPLPDLLAEHLGNECLDQPELGAAAERVDDPAVLAEAVRVEVLSERDWELGGAIGHQNSPAGSRLLPPADSDSSSVTTVKSWLYSDRPSRCVT